MAKAPTLEQRLAQLNALRDDDPTTPEAVEQLRKALGLQNNFVVERSAEIAGAFDLSELGEALIQAFGRFIGEPYKKDTGCRAKTACARALGALPDQRFDARDAVFMKGVCHVQKEPVYGGTIDTAGELRGVCIHSLAMTSDPRTMNLVADLLVDPEPPARRGAVAAAATLGATYLPMIRFAVRCGEDDPDVLHEMFSAILDLDDDGLAFVQPYLDDPDRCDTAALVIGESRHEQALPALKAAYDRHLDRQTRKVLVTAIAMQRQPASRSFLLGLIRDGEDREVAEQVVQALSFFKHEPGLAEQVRQAAVGQRLDRLIDHAFG